MIMNNLKVKTHISRISLVVILVACLLGATVQPAAASKISDKASVSVIFVVAGQSVTIRVDGLPANTPITVRMSSKSPKGAGEPIAGTAVTSGEGTLRATFAIPPKLRNKTTLLLRVELTANPRQYVYTYFTNVTFNESTSSGGTTGATIPLGTLSAGSINITNVSEDQSVTIEVTRAPGASRLAVWFDWMNNQGVMLGRRAGTITTNNSGNFTATIRLPSAVKDRTSLRIRLQGLDGINYLAYRWFINSDSSTGSGSGAASSSSGGLPYLRVIAVEQNDSVRISAYNFPKGEYVVKMDKVGEGAKHGIEVGKVKLKTGTGFTAAFDIPSKLEGEDSLTIRVQKIDEPRYFAFITFENK